LPLEDPNFSSIVWSCEPTFAKKILELHDNDFKIQLCDAFENMLGPILSATKRLHFPLRMRHAKNYVLPKIALVGDAAHTIHPLLGQGVNMGLADALCLSNIINSAFKSKRDFTNIHTLRKYERERRTNNFNLLASADIITNLFSNDVPVASGFRNFALDFCNGIPILKNAFAQYAMGN
jgi:2-octaprenylphenol hydroxylase